MFQLMDRIVLGVAVVSLLVISPGFAQDVKVKPSIPAVTPSNLGDIPKVHRSGDLILSGQFAPQGIGVLESSGVKRVISLRDASETRFDEAEIVTGAGLEHCRIPFSSEEALTDEVFDQVRELLRDGGQTTLLHCGSANRVGGVWLPYRVLDQGVDVATALKEAKQIGLKTPFIQRKALDYIQRKQAEAAANPQANPQSAGSDDANEGADAADDDADSDDANSETGQATDADDQTANGDADVTFVRAISSGDQRWKFEVTVKHDDTGWKDYANGWDVVLPDGRVVLASPGSKFTRPLAHPHVEEQPFTRSQQNLLIPASVTMVTVRAHDIVDQFGGKTVTVMLNQSKGDGFEVVR